MTDRVTNKQLEALCEQINQLHGVPNEPYKSDRGEDGRLVANAGTVYVAGAYGGVRLEQMCKGGGSRDLLSSGYGTKRELFNAMHSYIRGYRAANGERV